MRLDGRELSVGCPRRSNPSLAHPMSELLARIAGTAEHLGGSDDGGARVSPRPAIYGRREWIERACCARDE
jgi:hypothetical protein